MENWEFKNILDQSLAESEQRIKADRISREIDARKSVSAPMSLKGWLIAIVVFMALSVVVPTAYALLMLVASFFGLL